MEIITALPRYKKGHVRDDGMVFYGYNPRYKNGEYWCSAETYNLILERGRIAAAKKRREKPELVKEISDRRYLKHHEKLLAKARAYQASHKKERKAYNVALYAKQKSIRWANRIQKAYGISEAKYMEMLASQNNGCAICKDKCKSGIRLAIDHCHNSGKVRGLLCSKCNTAIGLLNDNPSLIIAAANYVSKNTPREMAC